MTQFRRYIAPGRAFTGRKLVKALQMAGTPPRIGRGLQMSSQGSRSVINLRKRQIIPRGGVTIFEARIESSTPIPPGTLGRWRYQVRKVRPTTGDSWEDVPGEPSITGVLNRVELNNTSANAGIQGYGIDLDDPNATITILVIRTGSIIQVTENKTSGGAAVYWFSAENPLEVVCL